jgi:conjugal transfer mating pair stabilization protein TraN
MRARTRHHVAPFGQAPASLVPVVLALVAWPTNAQTFPPGACSLVPQSQTCIDTTPCKTDTQGNTVCLSNAPNIPPGAMTVTETCWQWTYTFACGDASQDTCTDYENNPKCSLVSSVCEDYMQPSNVCDSWTYTFQCETAPAKTTTQLVCTNGLFDSSGFTAPSNANANFSQAALAQEILRQGQLYSNKGLDLFAGVSESCHKGWFGLQNCCSTAPGAKTNSEVSSVAFGAAAQVIKYGGEQAIDWASPYVFDAMYNNGIWTEGMTSLFATGSDTFGTTLADSGFTVGAFGFSYSTVNLEGQGLLNADNTFMTFANDGGFLEFNPYVFAATVAIMLIEQLMSCSNDEQLLAQHKGADLSVYEKTTCSDSILGICLQWADRYCSFNSILAKIIQTQGKKQLGLDPSDCSGLSLSQVSSLDFTRLDFSEFTASITRNVQNNIPTSAAIGTAYQPAMQSVKGGSAQMRTQVITSSPVGTSTSPPLPPNPVLPAYPN